MGLRSRLRRGAEQLGHLLYETQRLNNVHWWRWASVMFTDGFWVLASYRLSRGAYLVLGRGWPVMRVAMAPLVYLVRPWSGRCEINYHADIDRGLRVLHPTLGAVISGKTVAGKYLVLVGGNCIGGRRPLQYGDIRIGDNVLLGANACVMGPVTIGNDVRVGAGALVVKDAPDGAVLLAPLAQSRT